MVLKIVIALLIAFFGVFMYSLCCVASRADEQDKELFEQWVALHGKDGEG